MQNQKTEFSKTLFGQIDSYSSVKDYQRGGRCVRILAIEDHNFNIGSLQNPNGFSVISIDLSYWEFCRHELGNNRRLTKEARENIDSRDNQTTKFQNWYELEVRWNSSTKHGYAFRTFSEENPSYFELISCKPAAQNPKLSAPPRLESDTLVIDESSTSQAPWTLSAFHVGQGMCSVVSDGSTGFLLDLGAGKPITRPRYLREPGFKNDLKTALTHIKKLNLILSHADQDHWRILAWDKEIRDKINCILTPKDAKPIAFKDHTIIGKTYETDDLEIKLSNNSSLSIYRSIPSLSDDNSECLVTIFESNKKRALIAGDYVYERFLSDGNIKIKDMHTYDFDAVIVPHHGDKASSKKVLNSRTGAIAFFSAGEHKQYNHPNASSLAAHKSANYNEVCDKNCRTITKVHLI